MRRSGMRRVLAALTVLASMTVAACGGEATQPAAQTATSSPTPTIDVPGSSDNHVPPPETRAPSTEVFEWVEFVDEPSLTSAALPEDADPVEHAVTGPLGIATTSRGYVFEHGAGVIGFEVIDEFGTLDHLDQLAEFLAGSVGGIVESTEEVDAGRGRGVDGEISYGDGRLMLFRILVLNSNGDVWNGFVGGPADDRERLDSEFARLTTSADLRALADWVNVRDEPTGITVQLPSAVEPRDLSVEGMPQRAYEHDSGVGFLVIEYPPAEFDLAEGLAGLAESIGGTVESSEPTDAWGYEALDGVVLTDQWTYAYRLLALEEQVLVLYSADRAEALDQSLDELSRLTESVVTP